MITLINMSTLRGLFLRVLEGTPVSVPSAVSSMLERLCPRLMPLTAGGRSTLEPLSWGVVEVTSGGTLFSGEETQREREKCRRVDARAATAAVQLVIRPRYRCACGPERRPAGRHRAEAAAGSWALHGRGWRRRTRTSTSFGRSG